MGQVTVLGSASLSTEGESSSAVFNYLTNMRELVNAQRDVLMSYLGTPSQPNPPRQPVQRSVQSPNALPYVQQTVASGATSAPTAVAPAIPKQAALSPAKVLLALVSERTGYPEETLDLDLDLEADLSIDSIKRVEITGELSDALNLRNRLGCRCGGPY